jgi:Transglutaminase elicitor
MYDLELNNKGQIVGGEWYTNKHPDFLWLPPADSRAESYGDSGLKGSWTPGKTLPAFWRDIAVKTATKHGQPLAAIIEPLLAQANK